MAKDLFSRQTSFYAKYRPTYPSQLYEFILSFLKNRDAVWDCGTGNGQAAVILAGYFQQVKATDISARQLAAAIPQDNIEYIVSPSEHTAFPDHSFDLVTVAQAYHWFDFNLFKNEVLRVTKPGGVLAIWGYNLITTANEKLNDAITKFYTQVVGPYWDAERKYIEQEYETVPFEFPLITSKTFSIECNWFKQDLDGYLNSWSAVQNFIGVNNYNPVGQFIKEIGLIIKEDELIPVSFPVFLKLGRISTLYPHR